MTKPAKIKPTKTSDLPKSWATFAQKLANVLSKLKEGEFMSLSVKGSDRYVRFSLEWEFGMRLDTTSNTFLGEQEKLDEQQIASLIAAGWNAPTWTPDDMLPDDIEIDDLLPDGGKGISPNYFVDLNTPITYDTVASLTAHTFAEILLVTSPKKLEYYAYDEDDEPIEFPELGLTFEVIEDDEDDLELSQQLLETIRETVGIDDIELDSEGDIGVRYRSALSFIRMNHNGMFVSIYALLLTDVQESTAVYKRLNDINANEIMLRVFYRDGVIYAVADIPALPFVGIHVAEAFGHFCEAADRLGNMLKAEFGGNTAFEDNIQSTMIH